MCRVGREHRRSQDFVCGGALILHQNLITFFGRHPVLHAHILTFFISLRGGEGALIKFSPIFASF